MKKKGIIKILLILVIVLICSFLFAQNFKAQKKDIQVIEWSNIYNGNNIELFYQNIENISKVEAFSTLDKTYKIKELTEGIDSEIDKVLKTTEILNTIVEADDVSDLSFNSALDILTDLGTRKKVSLRDMAIIQRDLLVSAGFYARVGEFKKANPLLESKPSYYVVEYFSPTNNKWIMIDFLEESYFKSNDEYLSAIDFIKTNKKDLTYFGDNDLDTYYKQIKNYLSSYTVSIDNTITKTKSNSDLTYITSDKDIDLKKNNKYTNPTIFTENVDLFNKRPNSEISEEKDENPYIILQKKFTDDKKDLTFTLGAFQNGTTINEYYINFNGENIKVTSKYKEINLIQGRNTIELSLDNSNFSKKIVIDIANS